MSLFYPKTWITDCHFFLYVFIYIIQVVMKGSNRRLIQSWMIDSWYKWKPYYWFALHWFTYWFTNHSTLVSNHSDYNYISTLNSISISSSVLASTHNFYFSLYLIWLLTACYALLVYQTQFVLFFAHGGPSGLPSWNQDGIVTIWTKLLIRKWIKILIFENTLVGKLEERIRISTVIITSDRYCKVRV